MASHYSILDDEDHVYGAWEGHLHCASMYSSRNRAEAVAIENHIPGYKIVPCEAAIRHVESKYSKHK